MKSKKEKETIQIVKPPFVLRPVPTILSTMLCCLISGIIFLLLGFVILYMSSKIRDFELRYDNQEVCEIAYNSTSHKKCEVNFTLYEQMDPPIYVYYGMKNFYQNHRKFINSKSTSQLEGKLLNASDLEDECDPIITVKDLGIDTTIGGFILPPDAPANPCGLMPRSFFNDSYSLANINGYGILINETGIAWDSDRKSRFKPPLNADRIQWLDVTDEHFMVWMRPAGLPNFKKLWGRIETVLIPGNYTLIITNNYSVKEFSGEKFFIMSTSNVLGGRNNFLGIAYLVLGVVCSIVSIIFFIGYTNKVNTEKKNF